MNYDLLKEYFMAFAGHDPLPTAAEHQAFKLQVWEGGISKTVPKPAGGVGTAGCQALHH